MTRLTLGKKRKLKLNLPREGISTVRWMLTFLVLVVALMTLAYYVTYNGRVAPRAKATSSASNSTVTDSGAKKTTNSDKATNTDKKVTNSGKKATKSEKSSNKTGTKKSSKSEKQKKKSNKKGGKNSNEKVEKKEETKDNPKDRIYRRQNPYIDMATVDLTNIPVLQWPIAPADPDRPFIIEVLTGEKAIRRKKYKKALEEFKGILARFPQSPRGMFGKAETFCAFAEYKRSNKYLDLCIDAYWNVGIENILTNGELRRVALLRLADRATFRGKLQTSVRAWSELTCYFPEERHYARQVALTYLTAKKSNKALEQFKTVVAKWPDDAFSKAHIGLILKLEDKLEEALPLLLEGLQNDEDIRKKAEFYHHCGECLTKLGRYEEVVIMHNNMCMTSILEPFTFNTSCSHLVFYPILYYLHDQFTCGFCSM